MALKARREIIDVLSRTKSEGVNLDWEILQEGEPSYAIPDSSLAAALTKSIEIIKGEPPVFQLCPGLCEIRYFSARGCPAYAFGPGLLEVSHGPEEFVKIGDLLDCTAVFALTVFFMLEKNTG